MNYIIDYSKDNFIPDYNLYFKRIHKKVLMRLIFALIAITSVFLYVKFFFESNLVESILFGLLVFILYFIILRLYYIFTTKKRLKKSLDTFWYGKTNFIFDKTFLEIIKADKKRTIFYSQIKKVLVLNNVMFLIEGKSDYLPLKISREEASAGAFDQILEKLQELRIKVKKK